MDRLERFNALPTLPQLTELDASEGLDGLARDITSGLALYAKGSDSKLDRKVRREMLAAIAGGSGEVPEIEFDATTFLQRPEPNRNFVRFKSAALGGLGKSYATAPFLRNHDTDDVGARGGTVLASKVVKADEVTSFDMRIEPVKLWAVTGLLDGTIDRFSIGWSRTGPVECSVHKAPIFSKCSCWLGDEIDGKFVEWVIASAVGTECSAVNVPAVVGTGITGITKLSALDPARVMSILGAGPPLPKKEETTMQPDPALLARLGLSATATWADVERALAHQQLQLAQANDKLAAAERATDIAELAQRKTTIDTAITALAASGKIQPGGAVEQQLRALGSSGEQLPVATEADRTARKAAMASSLALFTAQVEALKTMPSVTAAGAALPAGTPDPVPPSKPPAAGSGGALTAEQSLEANPGLRGWLRNAGITQKEYEEHGQLGRFMVGSGMFEGARPSKA